MTSPRGRRVLRSLLGLVGVVLVLAGLLFAAQGAGWFPYPGDSVMVRATPWEGRGALVAAVGLALLLVSVRIGRR